MSSQIVFLFDIDQCLPLELVLKNEDVEFLIAKLKETCLKILTAASHIDGPSGDLQNLAHFSFRFYSSTGYFMVPDQHEGKFYEFCESSFDALDSSLSDRFEALLQTSKTNCFNSAALKQHILSGQKHQYSSLQKALEEIAVLYNWDRPFIHSPVKRHGKSTATNAVYVFTKLPSTNEELALFMGRQKSKKVQTHKDIFDKVFNSNRTMLNVFKGDALININVVDTDTYRGDAVVINHEYVNVKNAFKKCLYQVHGNVISFESFRFKNCDDKSENVHPTASILACQSENVEKQAKSAPKVSLICGGDSLELKSSDNLSDSAYNVVGLVKSSPCVRTIACENSAILWTSKESLSSLQKLAHHMLTHDYILVVKGDCNRTGILSHIGESVPTFHLKLLGAEMSKLCSIFLGDLGEVHGEDLSGIIKENGELPKKKPAAIPTKLCHFKGALLDSSYVPESKPFASFLDRLKSKEKSESESCLLLKKSYLPHKLQKDPILPPKQQMRRKTSEESLNSNKSVGGSNKHGRSRGAELLRLGSKNAELRRNSHEDYKENFTYANKNASQNSSAMEDSKKEWKNKFESQFNDSDFEKEETLLRKLTKLQLEMLDHGENLALVAFAEVTISILLKYVHLGKVGDTTLEQMMGEFFLVDTDTVTKRKGNKSVRIRDHKLQILFRMELHWFLASQEFQKQVEDDILVHLRRISIWDSPNEMMTFLQEFITPIYVNRQPELLCLLYEELNQPPPPSLRALFSPYKKSDHSSPEIVSSIKSNTSDVSYFSNPSWISNNVKEKSQPALERIKRIRRPQTFDNKTLQIDLGGKKAQNVGAPKATVSTKAKTPKRKAKKTPVKNHGGVRRNLSFDDGSLRKTPKKKLALGTPKKGELQVKKVTKTPKKSPKKTATPCKMTPGKRHQILVPETPTAKKGRRKSDGTHVIKESPDIDAIKQGKTTPRRMNASLNLRRKTSFYSGNVSRNLMAAEEQLNAQKLQNFNTSMPCLNLLNSGATHPSQVLFPHINEQPCTSVSARQRTRSISRCSTEAKTPKKDVNEELERSELKRSMRRLFEDTNDPEVTIKSPFKSPAASRQFVTPRKRQPSSRSSVALFSPEKPVEKAPGYDDIFDKLLSESDVQPPVQHPPTSRSQENNELLNTPTTKTYARGDKTPNSVIDTPDSTRPCRKRKITERMGIDDVKLCSVYSPKVRITPFAKHSHLLMMDKSSTAPVVEDIEPKENVDFDQDFQKLCDDKPDEAVAEIPVRTVEVDEEDQSLSRRVKKPAKKGSKRKAATVTKPEETPLLIKYPSEDTPSIEDSIVQPKICGQKRKRSEAHHSRDASNDNGDAHPPEEDKEVVVKFRYDVKAVESPNGEIKLKINRSVVKQPIETPVQRISRRTSMQLGISPSKIWKLQMQSPSPAKKQHKQQEQENSTTTTSQKFSPLSSTSLYHLTTSPILSCDVKERRLPKESPQRKRQRVSKKLYD